MISVVTITYNNFDELVRTLKSIEGLSNIESVVINGGQCLKTCQLLETYPGVVISEPDKGIADAFNKGVINSTCDAVVFLNSGDVLIDRQYYTLAQEIFDANEQVAYIHSDIIFDDTQIGEIRFRPKFGNIGAGIPFYHQSLIVKRRVFTEVGLFDLSYKYAMDYDFIARIIDYKGEYVPIATVKMDGNGVSVSAEATSIGECYRSLKSHNLISVPVLATFFIRYAKYLLRRLLLFVGGRRTLAYFKARKYS
jgi:glycosyltransferase involved in cell wall biosynthesis